MVICLIPAEASLNLVDDHKSSKAPDIGDQLLHVLRLSQGHPVEGEDGLHQEGGDLGPVHQASLDDCTRLLEVFGARVLVFLSVRTSVKVGNGKCVNPWLLCLFQYC